MSRQQRRFEARKGARTVGFTAVPNRRIAARHALQVMTLVQLGVAAPEAERQAWRDIAKSLLAPRMVANYSRKPTKNSDPAYRKSIWPASKIARRGEQS